MIKTPTAPPPGNQLGSLQFVVQEEPRGYADAIYRARDFVGDDPFLHLVGDHLYLSETDQPCAKQLIEVASEFECTVSAVQSTRENNLPYFGIVSGPRVPHRDSLYEVERVVEKPTPTLAEQELVTPGLRAGHYLGFFGMHVLTPEILRLIERLSADKTIDKADSFGCRQSVAIARKVSRLPVAGDALQSGNQVWPAQSTAGDRALGNRSRSDSDRNRRSLGNRTEAQPAR